MEKSLDKRFMATVTLGAKGQIVIPKKARDMFNLKSGDTLLLLADSERGIALHHYEVFSNMVDILEEKK